MEQPIALKATENVEQAEGTLGEEGNQGIAQTVRHHPAAGQGNTEATAVTVQKAQGITDSPVCRWRALFSLGDRRQF